ncbi:MAG: ADP-ribosyl-(dinitrogen reductase) glycohydrolase [Chloroflexi bacterium ADurb.Bin222]|nr:MAG: ADP-ribosyl-(dinitrogen reductase) glycohydrolase [Chloroflexi bacterium ADurb.Bin222]
MTTNLSRLNEFFAAGKIHVQRGALFERVPHPMPADFDFDRVEGMLLGLATGDALGNTTESQNPADRTRRHGEIRDYLPNRYAEGRAVGLPSDDSQMAFWTLEQWLADGALDPERLAQRFCAEQIFGIGQSVKEFVINFKAGKPWHASGIPSAGNGALMRIAPVLAPHLRTGTPALWADVALATMLTHNDPAALSASLAFSAMLWELLQMSAPPEPLWWVETYVSLARDLEGDTVYRPRGGAYADYTGPLWRFVDTQVRAAYEQGMPALTACDAWYSGAYLLETVPSVLYVLMRHADDPETALVRAVNDTRDNDTVGAIVGAAVGALHGRRGLPERWVRNLLGRTRAADDGQVFALLAQARERVCGEQR